jgi:formylglycine-generating enzyme required for sulfatase activity
MNYGDATTDFGKLANLADERIEGLCRGNSPKWIPAIMQVSDGATVTAEVGRYQPNAWGLQDMHGNVWEWTLSTYKPYPYNATDGRDNGVAEGTKVLRGGSFYDRPYRARSSFRLNYPLWQRAFNVGFRVICDATPATTVAQK